MILPPYTSLDVLFRSFALVAIYDRLRRIGYFVRLILRTRASKLTIDSFAPDPCAALAGSFFRKRALARNIEDGLPPSEHVEAAFSPELSLYRSEVAAR